MKKYLVELIYLSFVAVPLVLMAFGVMLKSNSVTDLVFAAATIGFLVYVGKRSSKVHRGECEPAEIAYPILFIGTAVAFVALVFQALYCGLRGNELMAVEGIMTWLFISLAAIGFRGLLNSMPQNRSTAIAVFLGLVFISVCAIGGIFDFFEYFTGCEIPQRLGDFFGILAPLSAVGCIAFLVIGLIQDNLRKD
jgi:hypothetical protein